jgi:polynucleotide 5'-kinase involved in rRNA processing
MHSAHMVPSGRSKYKPMGSKTKGWIKGMRAVQLCLRVLEVIGAVGLVVVMSLAGLLGWVIGVTVSSSWVSHQSASCAPC